MPAADASPPPSASPAAPKASRIVLTIVLMAVLLLFIFGKLSPCNVLGETLRADIERQGGIAVSLLPVMPPEALTRFITLSPEGLSFSACFTRDLTGETGFGAYPTPNPLPVPAALKQVGQTVVSAIQQCHDKREDGTLKTHVESVQCSNAAITAAYDKAGYPYKDIVALFTSKRLDLAAQLDRDNLTPEDEQRQMTDTMVGMVAAERERLARR